MKIKIYLVVTALVLMCSLAGCAEAKDNFNSQNIMSNKTPQNDMIEEKEWLFDSKYLTDNLEERKSNLLELFDHSIYNRNTITLVSKAESHIKNDGDENSVIEGYLYGITDEGQHVYFKDYGKTFVFYGKYSLYKDMYDFGGYDIDDKFVIYYNGDIPENGDISNMDLVSFIPEYTLKGSKVSELKLGEIKIQELNKKLYACLYEYENTTYNFMSIEEAIIAYLEELKINAEYFYKQPLAQGGYYYTDGNISIVGSATIIDIPYTEQSKVPETFVSYDIFVFEGSPSADKELFSSMNFVNSSV